MFSRLGGAFGVAAMMFVIFGPMSLLIFWFIPEVGSNPLMKGFLSFSLAALILMVEEPLRLVSADLRQRPWVPLSAPTVAVVLLGLAFGLPGAFLLIDEVPALVEDLRLDFGDEATGSVLSVEQVPGVSSSSTHGGDSYPVALGFGYATPGGERRATSYAWVDASAAPWPVGKTVVVWHVPSTAGLARVDGTKRSPTRYLVLFSLVFLLIGVVAVAGAMASVSKPRDPAPSAADPASPDRGP
jgi:hypothetical protein